MDNDTDIRATVTGDWDIDVGAPVAEYAKGRGIVDTERLVEAAADVRDGEIGTSLLTGVAAPSERTDRVDCFSGTEQSSKRIPIGIQR